MVEFEEAVRRLPQRKMIHTVRAVGSLLIGAYWAKQDLIEAFRRYRVEETEGTARKMCYGLIFMDNESRVFVETRT